VRLVSGRKLTLTVRAYPTRHSPIVPQATATDWSVRRSRVPARGCRSLSAVSGLWRSLVAHLTGGQGVASSNLASPTNTLHSIRPSRTRI
jgi:hypothetical protein